MKFSEQELQEIINGNPVGDDWPYLGGTLDDVKVHLQMIMNELNKSAGLEVDGDFDSYGSGFASYAHLFCKRPNNQSTYQRDGRTWSDGISLYLNKLTPIAVYGPETRTVFERGSSHGFLEIDSVGDLPDESWADEAKIITSILEEEGFTILARKELDKPLPFQAKINTNFGDKTLFDALFYWED